MEKDPVCGMDVEPATSAAQSVYKDKTYHFCSVGCKLDFEKEPERFLEEEVKRNVPGPG